MQEPKHSNSLSYITRLDMYGSKFQLRIGNESSQKSLLGSIMSFISIAAFLLLLGYFSSSLFDVSHPTSILSTLNNDNPALRVLNRENFRFVFALGNSKTFQNFVDESIYRVELYQVQAKRVPKGDTTIYQRNVNPRKIERCKKEKFTQKHLDIFKTLPLPDMYCLSEEDFNLEGTFFSPSHQNIHLRVFPCVNSTDPSKPICKEQEEIDKVLNFVYFTFAFTDVTIDPSNYTQPDQMYDGSYFTSGSINSYTTIVHEMKTVTVSTDRGWLLSDVSEETYLQKEEIKSMTDFKPNAFFLDYTFRLSKKIQIYNRSYTKIQNVAAEVGGVIKIIMLVCQCIIYFYNNSRFYEIIANNLYDLSNGRVDYTPVHNHKNNINFSNQNLIVAKNKTVIDKINQGNKIISEKTLKKLESNTNPPEFQLNPCTSYFSSLFPCCFRSNTNVRILNKAKKEINKKIDIVTILKQLRELDRLKRILLDEEVQVLLNLPNKEKLFSNDEVKSIKVDNDRINECFNIVKTQAEDKVEYKRLLKELII